MHLALFRSFTYPTHFVQLTIGYVPTVEFYASHMNRSRAPFDISGRTCHDNQLTDLMPQSVITEGTLITKGATITKLHEKSPMEKMAKVTFGKFESMMFQRQSRQS